MIQRLLLSLLFLFVTTSPWAAQEGSPAREHLRMDKGWRFAFGHPYDTGKDFDHATGYFSYLTKAGYADGPASPSFDDRAWRLLDLPHDWAVEMPFDAKGSHSHGYKAIGRNFPGTSVGWYRKTFTIPASDQGRRISLEFDGVHRDAVVWVNGFYMGRESSGYSDFRYDVSDVLRYGGENTVTVRVDVTLEEGWFYEGAGIYRHVWLTKTAPLHIAHRGTFVSPEVKGAERDLSIRTTVTRERGGAASFDLTYQVLDAEGKSLATGNLAGLSLAPAGSREFTSRLKVPRAKLWSIGSPNLYRLVTIVKAGGVKVDSQATTFGFRTLRFDPDRGFFLNGEHLLLKGTCNHQDHAGVGTAIPDALQEFRVKRLKEMGSNAYRCAHNPPTSELLDACDKLGMLVLVENRLMGTSPELLDRLERLVSRDRNHPCVFAWSLGNEEWTIEGNELGVQITGPSQEFVQRLDPTRRVTAATSWWGNGISTAIDVIGYNYFDHADIDGFHAKFPKRSSFATEESTTHQTRGVFGDDGVYGHLPPTDRDGGTGIEKVWKYYLERPFLGGLFLWTGFDYRGEETPFIYPAIASQYGNLDLCGFPKDPYYYLKTWWGDEPTLFLTPHWNWKGKEGKDIQVWVRSNCAEVELSLNGKSLGKKTMPVNSHLEWSVPYEPGVLSAKGSKGTQEILQAKVETTGDPVALALTPDRTGIRADGRDVSVVTVEVRDAKGRSVPTAGNEVTFTLEGPGHILGVGNGDPSSHEPDRYIEEVSQVKVEGLRMKTGGDPGKRPEVETGHDDPNWPVLFSGRKDDRGKPSKETPSNRVVRGRFELPRLDDYSEIIFFSKSLVDDQSLYLNGKFVASGMKRDDPVQAYPLPKSILRKGTNVYTVVGKELLRRKQWEELNQDPGYIRTVVPAGQWKRSLFNGLAQVLVQSEEKPGMLILKAAGKGLEPSELSIRSTEAATEAQVP